MNKTETIEALKTVIENIDKNKKPIRKMVQIVLPEECEYLKQFEKENKVKKYCELKIIEKDL